MKKRDKITLVVLLTIALLAFTLFFTGGYDHIVNSLSGKVNRENSLKEWDQLLDEQARETRQWDKLKKRAKE